MTQVLPDDGLKSCASCTRRLPAAEFYPDKRTPTGLHVYCKDCARRKAREKYYRHHDKILAYEKVRALTPERRAKRREYQKKVAAQNAKKIAARKSVREAVRAGRLTREPCVECGNPRSWGHHADYNKPLDVVWLCPRCHGKEHRVFAEGLR